ncbi:MAG: hypothetical protein Q9159_003854 [Coniocarpon cinnabarinum]
MTDQITSDRSADPFADPFADQNEIPTSTMQDLSDEAENSTLILGRNVSLTLARDTLIVVDETVPSSSPSLTTCCGLISPYRLPLHLRRTAHIPTRSISYYHILAADLSFDSFTITHASPPSPRSKVVRPTRLSYPVQKDQRPAVAAFASKLLRKAYPANTLKNKRIKVLVNPFGGRGTAQKWYTRDVEPIFRAAECELSVEQTRYKGHAVDIAEHLDTTVFDVVACCSGDGLPHEVFNGLAKQPDARRALKRVAVTQLPCGSGNAMSLNYHGTDAPSLAALAVIKGVRTPLDLCAVTQIVDGEEQRYLSFLSQAVGIVAETDLGTDHLRWMGDLRFIYGTLTRLFGKTIYPCDIAVKVAVESKSAIRRHCREYHANALEESTESSQSPNTRVPLALSSDDPKKLTTNDASPIGDSHQPRPDLAANEPAGPLPALSTTISTPLPSSSDTSSSDTSTSGWTPLSPYPTLGNFYAGMMPFMAAGMNFFAAALPHDGTVDLLTIDGRIPRLRALHMMLSLQAGAFFNFDEVNYRKVSAYRVVPRAGEGYISVDGERVPFGGLQSEVCQGLGVTLSKSGGLEGPRFE